MSLIKTPLPKNSYQSESGAREHSCHKYWTKSSSINSIMDFIQLSKPFRWKWSFRKQSEWRFLYYFFTSIQYKISNTITTKKVEEHLVLIWSETCTNTIGINFITLTATGIRCSGSERDQSIHHIELPVLSTILITHIFAATLAFTFYGKTQLFIACLKWKRPDFPDTVKRKVVTQPQFISYLMIQKPGAKPTISTRRWKSFKVHELYLFVPGTALTHHW